MKINNENENIMLHFIFHTNIYLSNFMDTCNEKHIKEHINLYGDKKHDT